MKKFFIITKEQDKTTRKYIKIKNRYIKKQLKQKLKLKRKTIYLFSSDKKIIAYKCRLVAIKNNNVYLRLIEQEIH